MIVSGLVGHSAGNSINKSVMVGGDNSVNQSAEDSSGSVKYQPSNSINQSDKSHWPLYKYPRSSKFETAFDESLKLNN
jgi:hypothetical protein